MNKLQIDMELLLELISEDTRGEGECYLNLNSGDVSYIPTRILNVIEDNSKLSELEEWEKQLIKEATDILKGNKENYLYIPLVEEAFTLSVMKEYILSVSNVILRQKLLNCLEDNNYSYNFNSILLKEGDIDSYYILKDYRYYEYIKKWLLKNEIHILQLE